LKNFAHPRKDVLKISGEADPEEKCAVASKEKWAAWRR
jgi:hypothetical protein